MIRELRHGLLLGLALLGGLPAPVSADTEVAWRKRMPDGSVITLVGVFVGERRELTYSRGNLAIQVHEGLTIWTTRTRISPTNWGFTKTVLVDEEGQEQEFAYEGPTLFLGPPPTSVEEGWGLSPLPRPGRPLRLRIYSARTDPLPAPVEFHLPPVEELRARQFVGRHPNLLMAEAVSRGDTGIIRMLLDRGAHPNVRDEQGLTPLMMAALAGDVPLAKLLLDQGAALDVRTPSGGLTALFHAIFWRRSAEMAELLLSRGADPNLPTMRVEPLWWALGSRERRGNARIVQALVRRGAKLNTRTEERLTPLAYAKKIKNREMVEVLRRAGASDGSPYRRKYPKRRR